MDNLTYEGMLKHLRSVPIKYRVPLTIDERRMIIKAIGAKVVRVPTAWSEGAN